MFGRDDFRIARETHYERFLGPVSSVAHSMSLDLLPLHIDVYEPQARPRCTATRQKGVEFGSARWLRMLR